MFDDSILEVERRALILFLSQVSSRLKLTRKKNSEKEFSKYTIASDNRNLKITFDFENNQDNTADDLKNIVKFVYDEFDFVLNDMKTELEVLDQIAVFNNGIINLLKEEEQSQPTITFEGEKNNSLKDNILAKIQTISKIADEMRFYSHEEKDTLLLCEYLLEHLSAYELLQNGSDLLDFLDGTLIVENCIHDLLQPENILSVLKELPE